MISVPLCLVSMILGQPLSRVFLENWQYTPYRTFRLSCSALKGYHSLLYCEVSSASPAERAYDGRRKVYSVRTRRALCPWMRNNVLGYPRLLFFPLNMHCN